MAAAAVAAAPVAAAAMATAAVAAAAMAAAAVAVAAIAVTAVAVAVAVAACAAVVPAISGPLKSLEPMVAPALAPAAPLRLQLLKHPLTLLLRSARHELAGAFAGTVCDALRSCNENPA